MQPNNLEQVREQIANKIIKRLGEDISDRRGLKQEWRSIDKEVMAEIETAWKSIILSTPILERTCPECGGKGGWLITSTNIGVIQGWQKCECKSGKVPFTVGDAINKAIKELK